VSFVGITFS